MRAGCAPASAASRVFSLRTQDARSRRLWTNARPVLTRQAMGGTVSAFFSDMVTTVVAYDISSGKCQEALKWTADGTKVPLSAVSDPAPTATAARAANIDKQATSLFAR
jgi:hypothetical protein